jgi:SPP1 family predicted phage head-tail adaptor
MRSEELNKRITLLFPSGGTTIVDGLEQVNYVTGATVRASFEPLQGRELFLAQANNPELTVKFKIRYIKGLSSNIRVRYESDSVKNSQGIDVKRLFDVVSPPIDTKGQGRELVLMCKEVVQ